MSIVPVPKRLLEDAKAAINTLGNEVTGKGAADWGVVNAALIGLETALRIAPEDVSEVETLRLELRRMDAWAVALENDNAAMELELRRLKAKTGAKPG